MNQLHVGLTNEIELPKGGYLFIDDEVPRIPRARVFDPANHSFDPLKDITYKKARELADVLYTIAPQGENTLTVRNGKRSLLPALLEGKRLNKIRADDEVEGMLGDLLESPIVRRVLCSPTNFSFNPASVILARINRAELGEFDALVLGLFLIGHYQGQLVIPDFGFYGRNVHVSLLRDNRLICGVNFLHELPDKLRQNVLLVKDKVASGATYEDAVALAQYARLRKDTNEWNDFIGEAIA